MQRSACWRSALRCPYTRLLPATRPAPAAAGAAPGLPARIAAAGAAAHGLCGTRARARPPSACALRCRGSPAASRRQGCLWHHRGWGPLLMAPCLAVGSRCSPAILPELLLLAARLCRERASSWLQAIQGDVDGGQARTAFCQVFQGLRPQTMIAATRGTQPRVKAQARTKAWEQRAHPASLQSCDTIHCARCYLVCGAPPGQTPGSGFPRPTREAQTCLVN
jgi:hypothetical protein